MRKFPATRQSAVWWSLPEVLSEILLRLKGASYRPRRDLRGRLNVSDVEYLAKLYGEIPYRITLRPPEGEELEISLEFRIVRPYRRR